MVHFKTENEKGNLITLYVATDDGATHYTSDTHFATYMRLRKNTPKQCIIKDTVKQVEMEVYG